MKIINLRNLFPEYQLNCCIEVPDDEAVSFIASLTKEIAEVYVEFQRKENAYQRQLHRKKAHYTIDKSDGIVNDAICLIDDPVFEEYISKLSKQQFFNAVSSLPEKQAKRVYSHYVLGMSKAEIARIEGVDEKNVRQAIERGIESIKKYLKSFSE